MTPLGGAAAIQPALAASRSSALAGSGVGERVGRGAVDRPARSRSAVQVGSFHAPSGSITTWRHRWLTASHARSAFEVTMSPTRITRSGRSSLGRVAQERVVAGDDVAAVVMAGAQLRGRLGQDRVAGAASERARSARPRPGSRWRPATITPRGSAGDGAARASPRARRLAESGAARTVVSGAPSGRPSSASWSWAVHVSVDRRPARAAPAAGRSGAPGPAERPSPPPRLAPRPSGSGAGPRRRRRATPSSQNQRTADPYSLSWSIVWPAPRPRSSGGRSAVITISGNARLARLGDRGVEVGRRPCPTS